MRLVEPVATGDRQIAGPSGVHGEPQFVGGRRGAQCVGCHVLWIEREPVKRCTDDHEGSDCSDGCLLEHGANSPDPG